MRAEPACSYSEDVVGDVGGEATYVPRAGDPSAYLVSADRTAVHAAGGKILGALYDGVYRFLGVRYARAERFMPPRPIPAWDGLEPALAHGPNCPTPPMDSVPADELFIPHRYQPESEDCLVLNVWTPAIEDGGQRPVLVWLHGGGYTSGSAIEHVAYDGHNLSRSEDVVVVSLNHRLNVLGFLDLSAYGADYRHSGNVGVLDLVAALTWVRDNVAAFGGDPGNVTVFGQSGGGAKVATLMGMPAAEGLFARAVIQSGAYASPVTDQVTARTVAGLTLGNLGLARERIDRLRDVPYRDLIAAGTEALEQATAAGAAEGRWAPVLDGDTIPGPPIAESWAPQARPVPLLIGSVLNEFETVLATPPMALLVGDRSSWSRAHVIERLRARFGDRAGAVAEAFAKAYPDKPIADACFVDTAFRPGTIRWADAKAAQAGAPVYSYLFTKTSPVMGGIAGAYHCAEIPYVFANVGRVPQATGGDGAAFALAGDVSAAWASFARTGRPSAPGLPEWPAYTVDRRATMLLDDVSRVADDPDGELMRAAGALPPA